MTGTMYVTDDGQVAVTATSQYQPVILLMIGHQVTQAATVGARHAQCGEHVHPLMVWYVRYVTPSS